MNCVNDFSLFSSHASSTPLCRCLCPLHNKGRSGLFSLLGCLAAKVETVWSHLPRSFLLRCTPPEYPLSTSPTPSFRTLKDRFLPLHRVIITTFAPLKTVFPFAVVIVSALLLDLTAEPPLSSSCFGIFALADTPFSRIPLTNG